MSFFFFFNDTATTEIYTLSLHDALPISPTVNFLPRALWRRRRSVVRSSDMADAKPRNLRRVALGTTGLVLLWLFGVWPPPVWWRNHWPRETAMMREQADCRSPSACPTVSPTDLQSISPVLQRDRKSTRLNSSHGYISYAVFCLKKKKNNSYKSTL